VARASWIASVAAAVLAAHWPASICDTASRAAASGSTPTSPAARAPDTTSALNRRSASSSPR
jgi:hypothetical protein